jgi:hypothetical protein
VNFVLSGTCERYGATPTFTVSATTTGGQDGRSHAGQAERRVQEGREGEATQPTDAEKKKGILARRKVRATGHVIERIDGKLNPLGEEGGRWIIRVVDSGKVHHFPSRSEMVKAGRTL